MREAVGVIELSSIARGIDVSDQMLKVSNAQLVKASTVCPGKYIVIIGGSTSDVETSMKRGMQAAGEYYVDSLLIPNIHSQLIPAIGLTNPVDSLKAIGVMEFYSVTSGIRAADIAAKAANITLIEVKIGYAIGGKGVVLLTGDVEAVKTAVAAAIAETELLLSTTVIARPSEKILQTLL